MVLCKAWDAADARRLAAGSSGELGGVHTRGGKGRAHSGLLGSQQAAPAGCSCAGRCGLTPATGQSGAAQMRRWAGRGGPVTGRQDREGGKGLPRPGDLSHMEEERPNWGYRVTSSHRCLGLRSSARGVMLEGRSCRQPETSRMQDQAIHIGVNRSAVPPSPRLSERPGQCPPALPTHSRPGHS